MLITNSVLCANGRANLLQTLYYATKKLSYATNDQHEQRKAPKVSGRGKGI